MAGDGWLSVSLWSVERKRRVGVSVRLLSCVCLFEVSVCDNYGSRSGASRPHITEESGRRNAGAPIWKKNMIEYVVVLTWIHTTIMMIVQSFLRTSLLPTLIPFFLPKHPGQASTHFTGPVCPRLCTAKSFLMIAYFRLSLASVHSAALS